MRRRKVFLFLLLAVFTLGMVSCGKKDEDKVEGTALVATVEDTEKKENNTDGDTDKTDASSDTNGEGTASGSDASSDTKDEGTASGSNVSSDGKSEGTTAGADVSSDTPEGDNAAGGMNGVTGGMEGQPVPGGMGSMEGMTREDFLTMMAQFGGFDGMSEEEQKATAEAIMAMSDEEFAAMMTGLQNGDMSALGGMAGDETGGMAALMKLEGVKAERPVLPADSKEFSQELCKNALAICTGHSKSGEAQIFTDIGFEVLSQKNYDKANSDSSHTSAYTVAKGRAEIGGEMKDLIVVAIRGTNAGEWYSNFNFSNSRSDETVYSENFLESAGLISMELLPIFIENPDTPVLICGHSRGAAVGNLLGMLLNETRGIENVYCYTYATPTTYRGEEPKAGCENIFNIINPCDVVPLLPVSGWGFYRVGNDIILPNDPNEAVRLAESIGTFAKVAPTISQYYNERHSLTSPGLSEEGMTAYEVMLAFASTLTRQTTPENGGVTLTDLYGFIAANPVAVSASDLMPLLEKLQKVIGMDGSFGTELLAQHMPAVYLQLMEAQFAYWESSPTK